jgi:GT2 family glycosyltransferase
VSVCIPAHQPGRYLAEAVGSVLAQARDDVEVLVVDDASTDGTCDALEAMAHPIVSVMRHRRRQGIVRSRNALLEASRGELVVWLDADDLHLPGTIGRQLAAMRSVPGAAFVHGACTVVDAHGVATRPWPRAFAVPPVLPGSLAREALLLGNHVTTSTVMARRDAHAEVGWFRGRLDEPGEDWDMWLRLAAVGAVAYVDEPVAAYRQHPASVMARARAAGSYAGADRRVLERALATTPAGPLATGARLALARRALDDAWDLLTRRRRWSALAAVSDACRWRPGWRRGRPRGRSPPPSSDVTRSPPSSGSDQLTRDAAAVVDLASSVRRTTAAARPPDTTECRAVAATVRGTSLGRGHVAFIDKWDPRMAAAAGVPARRAHHFPDRRLLPGGYPADSDEAVDHLHRVVTGGVTALVVPASAFWWLEFYPGFAVELERHWDEAVHTDQVRAWRLPRRSRPRTTGSSWCRVPPSRDEPSPSPTTLA